MSKLLSKQKLQMFLSSLKTVSNKGIDKLNESDELKERIMKRGTNANIKTDDIENILRSEKAINNTIYLLEQMLEDRTIVDNHSSAEKALKQLLPHVHYTIQSIKITDEAIVIKPEKISITSMGSYMGTVEKAEFISMSVKNNVREKITTQVIDSLETLATPNLNIIMLTLDNKSFWEDKELSSSPFYVTDIGTPEFKFYYPSSDKFSKTVYRDAMTSSLVNISKINNKIEYRALVPNKAASKLATCYLYNVNEVDIDKTLNRITSGASDIAINNGDVKAYERSGGSETQSHLIGFGKKYAVINGTIKYDGSNFMDGWSPISAKFMSELLTEASTDLFEFTEKSMLGYGFQCKFSGVDKSNRTCVTKEFMKLYLEIAENQGLKVDLYNCDKYEDVDIVFDNDTLKAPINFGADININVVSWNKKPSKPNFGLQMWSKIYMNSPTGYEFILNKFNAVADEMIEDMIKPDESSIRSTSYGALEKALILDGKNPIDIDSSIRMSKVRATMDKINKDINRFKIPVEGFNTVIVPPAINLFAEFNTINFNEIFFPGFQSKFEELYYYDRKMKTLEKKLRECKDDIEKEKYEDEFGLAEAEKLYIMQNNGIEKRNGHYARKVLVTKNPTQGRYEYHICYCISVQCIKERMRKHNNSKAVMKLVEEFLRSLHIGNSISPHYKELKNKLAGLDHDWDKWPIVTEREIIAEAEKGYRNVYCVID